MATKQTRKPTKKKVALPNRRNKQTKIVEEKHIGTEIVNWPGEEASPVDIRDCLRHYGYFYDVSDTTKWLKEWAKKNASKKVQTAISRTETKLISVTLGGLAKMKTNGAIFPEKTQQWFDAKIDEIVARAPKPERKKSVVVDIPKKTPADIVKEKTSDFIAEVDAMIDEIDFTKKLDSEYSIYDELTKIEAPYNTAKAVFDYYKPLLDELDELCSKKPSQDLVEGYSHMKPLHRKRYRTLVSGLVSESERYMATKKAVRKPRKPKVKSAGQQVSKVQYLAQDDTFKVASNPPEKIVGASVVYLFNVRYKTLTRLETNAAKGFEIKGTTIQNIDPDKSSKKTVRKAETEIAQFVTGTKARMKKAFDALKTKPQEAKGRMNKDTIILRVF